MIVTDVLEDGDSEHVEVCHRFGGPGPHERRLHVRNRDCCEDSDHHDDHDELHQCEAVSIPPTRSEGRLPIGEGMMTFHECFKMSPQWAEAPASGG